MTEIAGNIHLCVFVVVINWNTCEVQCTLAMILEQFLSFAGMFIFRRAKLLHGLFPSLIIDIELLSDQSFCSSHMTNDICDM